MRSNTPRWSWPLALLILLAGFGLRVWQVGEASLWYDEILTEARAQARLDRCLTMVLESGNQTPLYFVSLHLFPTGNELLLRFPSVLAGVTGIALMMHVTRRLYGRHDLALIAGALLAFNPYHIWLSRTARPYALLFVLALLASYAFLLLLRGQRSRTVWTVFTLGSMAAYMTHYFAAGLPLAQYALFAFILRGNRGFFRRWMRAQVIAGVPLLIWVYALMQQEQVAFGIGWIPRPGPEDVPLTFWNMLVGYDGALHWYLVPGLLAAGIGLAVGLAKAVRQRAKDRVDFYWFWLVIAPLVLAFAVSVVRPLYVDRYFMILLPALLLIMLRGWQSMPPPRWTLVLAGLVMTSGASSVLITVDEGRDQKEDWRGAAQVIAQERQPGDALLLEAPITLLMLRRYLEDAGMPYAWLEGDVPPADQYGEPVRRVWAIYRNPRDDGHRQGVLPAFDPFAPDDSLMPDWLIPRREQVIAQREFHGVTVLLVDVEDMGP